MKLSLGISASEGSFFTVTVSFVNNTGLLHYEQRVHYKNQKILPTYGNITVNITSYTLHFSGKTYELDTDGKFV